MKPPFLILLFLLGLVPCIVESQAVETSVTTEERTVGGDPRQRCFLVRHRLAPAEAPKEFALLLILPGGTGGAEFLPFCANVLTAQGTPKDFVVAELVAPVWGKLDETSVVSPGRAFSNPEARFSSEDFVGAVTEDVSKLLEVHDGRVFTLGWSSSGHVLYSSSFGNPKIRGTFIAMSRFQPAWFAHPENARGKRYYLWHSPEDQVCPYAESESAATFLTGLGATTRLRGYMGGHGWQPFTFYADRIREALEWFRTREGTTAAGGAAQTPSAQVDHPRELQ